MGRRRVVTTALLVSCAAAMTLWVAHERLLASAARWLNVATPPQRTDCVFILNGDVNVRPFIGAALVNAGLASQALLVPIRQSPKRKTNSLPPSHQLARKVLIHQGVTPDKIHVIDGHCTNTFDEAQSLCEYITKLGDESVTVAIVTSDFHTRRTRWTYHRVFGDRRDRLHFVAAPTEGFDETNWWRVEDGFMTYGTEFLKLGFYTLRYGNGVWVCGGMATLVLAAIGLRRFRRHHSDRVKPSYA